MKSTVLIIALTLMIGLVGAWTPNDQEYDGNAYLDGRRDGQNDSYANQPISNNPNAWSDYQAGRSSGASDGEYEKRYPREDREKEQDRLDR